MGITGSTQAPTVNALVRQEVAPLDASRLIIKLTKNLKSIPEKLSFGEVKTDHMLVVSYEPQTGWSAPEIKPYGPLSLDPAVSCLHYCTTTFEGMKAYLGPDGEPRLFRPKKNMERLAQSAERLALPPFDTDALLVLIKRLVKIEARWIPSTPGHSLYIRPTLIGTSPVLGVNASDSALVYVILTPCGPYFSNAPNGISLLATDEIARSWPGGTGAYKLGVNYSPSFLPQRHAVKRGYTQILWLLGEDHKITEVGAMNFFAVVKREDGDLDIITPALDGTILAGITRMSCLELLNAHNAGKTVLPGIPSSQKLHTYERILTMSELVTWSSQGRLLEAFGVGTAVIVAPITRIGYEGRDIDLPGKGLELVGKALSNRLSDIRTGLSSWEDWSVTCDE